MWSQSITEQLMWTFRVPLPDASGAETTHTLEVNLHPLSVKSILKDWGGKRGLAAFTLLTVLETRTTPRSSSDEATLSTVSSSSSSSSSSHCCSCSSSEPQMTSQRSEKAVVSSAPFPSSFERKRMETATPALPLLLTRAQHRDLIARMATITNSADPTAHAVDFAEYAEMRHGVDRITCELEVGAGW